MRADSSRASTAVTPIAYIVSRFPKLTETFILREVLELQQQGQPIIMYPLLRVQEQLRHREAAGLMSMVQYTPFISAAIVAANVHYLRRSPRIYLKLLWSVLRGTWGSTNLFIGALGIFPKSVYLARLVETQRIPHVHAHFATHPALAAMVISRLTGASFSFTAHAHDIFVHHKMLGEKIRQARFVVAISEFNRHYLLKKYPQTPAGKIKVVHCGVELEKCAVAPRRPGNGRFHILCVASLQPYKGIGYLLKACALLLPRLGPFTCTIVGEGEDRTRLERMIAEMKLQQTVVLLGGQPQNAVVNLLANADLFVLPSVAASNGQMEGIPVALMEAMASGLPVVATRLSGIPELVQDGITGLLVPPGNGPVLAEAIAALYKEESLRQEMGRRGLERVAAEFELKVNVAKLSRFFTDSVNKRYTGTQSYANISRQVRQWVQRYLGGYEDDDGENSFRWQAGGKDSEVYEVLADRRRADSQHLILKVHKAPDGSGREQAQQQATREYEALAFLWEQFRSHSTRLGVPRPLGFFPEIAAVLMEKCQGVRLDRQLRWARLRTTPAQRRLYRQLGACGEWLGLFHQITAQEGDPCRIYQRIEQDFYHELNTCRNLGLDPELANYLANTFEIKKEITFTGEHTIVGRHCDFGPYNVFLSNTAVCVIDFEGFQAGIIYDDLCYFLAMIEAMPTYHLSNDLLDRMRQRFLDGYAKYQPIDRQQLDVFMLVSMVKNMGRSSLLNHKPSGRRDRWRQKKRKALYAAWFMQGIK